MQDVDARRRGSAGSQEPDVIGHAATISKPRFYDSFIRTIGLSDDLDDDEMDVFDDEEEVDDAGESGTAMSAAMLTLVASLDEAANHKPTQEDLDGTLWADDAAEEDAPMAVRMRFASVAAGAASMARASHRTDRNHFTGSVHALEGRTSARSFEDRHGSRLPLARCCQEARP